MNKLFGLMMASALAVGASAAMADDTTQQHGQTGAQQQGQTGAQQGQTGAQQQTKQGMQGKTGGQTHTQKQAGMGLHEVQGHIVDIDKAKGNVKVQTDQGQLEFLFPPASLQGLNQGDAVRLEVAIKPALKTQQKQQEKKNEQK